RKGKTEITTSAPPSAALASGVRATRVGRGSPDDGFMFLLGTGLTRLGYPRPGDRRAPTIPPRGWSGIEFRLHGCPDRWFPPGRMLSPCSLPDLGGGYHPRRRYLDPRVVDSLVDQHLQGVPRLVVHLGDAL